VNAHGLDRVEEHCLTALGCPRTTLRVAERVELLEVLRPHLAIHVRHRGLAEVLDEGTHPAVARIHDPVVHLSPSLARLGDRRDGPIPLLDIDLLPQPLHRRLEPLPADFRRIRFTVQVSKQGAQTLVSPDEVLFWNTSPPE
jgi:hypothetical protein